MVEAEGRAAVAGEARTWLGTPYAHRQRARGLGVDCAQFPLAVYTAAGVIAPVDVGAYSTQWHLHRSRELYIEWVGRFAREIGREQAQPGDFAVWRYGRTFSHGAIVLAPPRVIHAVRDIGVTLDDWTADEALKTRPMRVFSLWG